MPKSISQTTEGRILALRAENFSYSVIQKRLKSENIMVSLDTIGNVINRVGKNRKSRDAGQQFKINRTRPVRNKKVISKVSKLCDLKNVPTQASMAKKLDCSISTINRVIHQDLSRKTRKKTKGHQLNQRQISNRKLNAKKLYLGPVRPENYEYLVTLDESWLYLQDCSQKNNLCYLEPGQSMDAQEVITRHELGGQKIMVVGILTGRGPLPLKFVKNNVKINSQYYCDQVLLPMTMDWLPKLYPEGLERVFVHHDAAPSHVSLETRKFMEKLSEEFGISFIQKEDIPIKSPDASPLDFFGFGYLKQLLRRRNVKTLNGLCKAANDIWTGIDKEMVLRVFDSWNRRLKQIVVNQGKHIEQTKTIHRRILSQKN